MKPYQDGAAKKRGRRAKDFAAGGVKKTAALKAKVTEVKRRRLPVKAGKNDEVDGLLDASATAAASNGSSGVDAGSAGSAKKGRTPRRTPVTNGKTPSSLSAVKRAEKLKRAVSASLAVTVEEVVKKTAPRSAAANKAEEDGQEGFRRRTVAEEAAAENGGTTNGGGLLKKTISRIWRLPVQVQTGIPYGTIVDSPRVLANSDPSKGLNGSSSSPEAVASSSTAAAAVSRTEAADLSSSASRCQIS